MPIDCTDLTTSSLPAHIHRSRAYTAKPEPCDCPTCGRLATDPIPPVLIEGMVIDCPQCGAEKPEILDDRTPAQRLRADIRDMFEEDAERGNGKSRSGGGGRKSPKKTYRVERRYEQEPVFGRPDKVKITVSKANRRKEIALTKPTRERLQKWAEEASERTGKRVSMADGIRVAQKIYLGQLGDIEEHEYASSKAEVQMLFYEEDLEALDRVCEPGNKAVSRGAALEACLLLWLPTVEETET